MHSFLVYTGGLRYWRGQRTCILQLEKWPDYSDRKVQGMRGNDIKVCATGSQNPPTNKPVCVSVTLTNENNIKGRRKLAVHAVWFIWDT